MSRTILLSLAAAAACFLAPRLADAGCPSSFNGGCDMASATAFAGGPSCLSIEIDENSCVCETRLLVTNNCTDTLEFHCATGACSAPIPVGTYGQLDLPLPGADALGPHEATIEARVGATGTPFTVSYEMVHVETGGCSAGGGGALAFAPVLLGGALLLRRRRRR